MARASPLLRLLALASALSVAHGGCQNVGTSLHLNEENFEAEVIKSDALFTFVEFSSPWCIWAIPGAGGHGNCKEMRQTWDELAEKWGRDHALVTIGEVDCSRFVMNGTALCAQFGIEKYPTMYYFSGATGAKGKQYEGGHSFEEMSDFIEEQSARLCAVSEELEPSAVCNKDEVEYLREWSAQEAATAERELARLNKISAASEVEYSESVREWMGRRIHILKQVRARRSPRPTSAYGPPPKSDEEKEKDEL